MSTDRYNFPVRQTALPVRICSFYIDLNRLSLQMDKTEIQQIRAYMEANSSIKSDSISSWFSFSFPS